MKIHVCDYCHLQNNGGGISPAVVTRTLTVEGVTYEVDVCQTHDDKWYGPLVTLLQKIGSAAPRPTEPLNPPPEPVDDANVREHEAEPPHKRRGPAPKELWPHLPKPGPDGKIECPKPGCTDRPGSPASLVEHMRKAHPIWYYSDESRQWRPSGPRGDVKLCEVCGEPAIGGAGVALHLRKTHPREYKAIKAAKAAKPGPPK